MYYARVMGDFRKASKESEGEEKDLEATCDKHVYCVSNVEARWDCAEIKKVPFEFKSQAKEAFTTFKFIHYDEEADQSIIMCYPKTGRTHQIRVHLKSLGYPIAND